MVYLFIYMYMIRTGTPRSRKSGAGFAFRLDERAAKRKEVRFSVRSRARNEICFKILILLFSSSLVVS